MLIEPIRSEPVRGSVFDANQRIPYFSEWGFETNFESKCPDGIVAVTDLFYKLKLVSRWRRCLRSSVAHYNFDVRNDFKDNLGLSEFLSAINICAALPVVDICRLPCGNDFLIDWARRFGIK
jgi:hypothetical protein